jgi:ABC-2 type transport system permease protein
MRYLKLISVFVRLGVLNELQYRANFFIQIFEAVLSLLVSLGGLAVIFEHTDTLGGWRPSELLAVVGVYFIIGAFIGILIQPSMQRFMEDIRQGTLDFTLTKPEDSQLLVSFKQIQIWKVADLLMGIGVLLVALTQMGAQVGIGQALVFVAVLLAGGATVYSFYLILATCSFWVVRVENILVIFQSMYEAGRWPVGIYPGWLRFTLTFLVPVAFAVTIPAETVSGRLTLDSLAVALGLSVALLVISRWFWRFGLRHYSGASA